MTGGFQYGVIPMPEREHNQKIESVLKEKYKSPTVKKLTLNERFGVIEKGYMLQADGQSNEASTPVHLKVYERNLISKQEFVEKYLLRFPNHRNVPNEDEEDKENSSEHHRVKDIEKPAFTTEMYIRELEQSIIQNK